MKRSLSVEATSCGDSADGLVGDDVIGDVIQSQDSAGSLLSRRKLKRRRREDPVASYSAISRCYWRRLCVVISADKATVSSCNAKIFSRGFPDAVFDEPVASNSSNPVESLYISAVATHPVARNPDAKNQRYQQKMIQSQC
ncbi:hypothetical protein F511_44140 [Dorcoceras hygrometricum]|uniref:Uncharacterized protein n=1 Tax=Dorcoceras hygrometricum TaxID=472368 RepID=A0A2Z7BXJ1_9LAMI|nr:hypothetical protein F511_44140 [Dorcoceras hygrometricum]